jgi:hypothetical protein
MLNIRNRVVPPSTTPIYSLSSLPTEPYSITLSYTNPDDASVNVYYRESGVGDYQLAGTDIYTLTGLSASTTYEVYTVAVKDGIESSVRLASTEITTTSDAVTNLNITSVTPYTVSISYSKPNGTGDVEIYYKRLSDENFTLAGTNILSLGGLSASAQYQFYARTVTNGRRSRIPGSFNPFTAPTDTVTNLNITSVTPYTVSISYSKPNGTGDVEIYYKRLSDANFTLAGTNIFSLGGLSASTVYRFYARTLTNGIRSPVPDSFEALTTTTDAVTISSFSNIKTNRATVNYQIPQGVNSVTIYYKAAGAANFIPLATGTSILTGLTHSTQYYVYARSQTGSTQSPIPGTSETFTTLSNIVTVSAFNVGRTTAQLSYNEPDGPDSVTVYYKIDDGESGGYTPMYNTPRILTGLTPSTTYRIYAVSVTDGNESDYNNTVVFQTNADIGTVYPVVEDLQLTPISSYRIALSYTIPTGTSVRIYYRVSGVGGYQGTELNVYELTNLLPSTTYQVYAVSVTDGNESNYLEIKTASTPSLPINGNPPVSNFRLSNITSESVDISYDRDSTTTLTILYYKRTIDATYDYMYNGYGLTGLSPSTSYTVYVVSLANGYNSSRIDDVTFQTLSAPVGGNPSVQNFSASSTTPYSITLTYTIPTNTSVRIYYRVSGIGTYELAGRNIYQLTNLTGSTEYEVYAVSLQNGSESPVPPPTTITTLSDTVTGLHVTATSPYSVSISYTRPTGTTSVEIYYRALSVANFSLAGTGISSLSGLTASTQYQFYARSLTNSRRSPIPGSFLSFSTITNAVTNLTVPTITTNSVQLSYNAPVGTSAKIYYKRASDINYLYAGINTLSLSDLTPSTTYRFTATSIIGDIESPIPSTYTQFITATPAGDLRVRDLTKVSITTGSITLTYTQPTNGAISVKLYLKAGALGTFSNVSSTSTSGFNTNTLTGLTEGVTYYLYAVALNAENVESAQSQTITFTVGDAFVDNLNVLTVGISTASFSYTTSDIVDAVKIYYKRSGTYAYTPSSHPTMLFGLTPSTEYKAYAVTIKNGIESLVRSEEKTFTTLAMGTATPGGEVIVDLAIIGSTDTSISFSYTPYARDKKHTLIYYRKLGSTDEFRSLVDPTNLIFGAVLSAKVNNTTIYALTPSTSYEVYVTSNWIIEKPDQQGPASGIIVITTLPAFETIHDLTVRSVTTNSARIKYTKPDTADSVKVYCKRSVDSTYSLVGTDIDNITGLLPSTTYNIYIRSAVNVIEYTPSIIRTFVTLSVSNIIKDLALLSVTHNSVNISYTRPDGITNVKIYYKPNLATDFISAGINITSISGLTSSTLYNIYAVSVIGSSESAHLDAINFTTLPSDTIIPLTLLAPVNLQELTTPFITSARYVIPKPLNCVSYDVEIEECNQ